MKVLVTGGTGFLGNHVCAALSAQNIETVVCSSARNKPAAILNDTHIQCDLLDLQAISVLCAELRPTHIVHLAWGMNEPGGYWTSRENLHWLAASQYLMQAFATTGGCRFVGVGTCVEYSPTSRLRDEYQTPTTPDTLYGKAKLACGNALQSYATGFSFSAAWCRLFYLLGPGEAAHRLIPSACRALQERKTFHCLDGERIFDYIDVRDAASAIARLLLSEMDGTVNVASGTGIQVRDLLNRLAKVNNSPPCFTYAIEEQKRPSIIAATKRLCYELGFRPQFSLEQSLHDCYQYSLLHH